MKNLKYFLTNHEYIKFLFCNLVLPCFSALLIIFNALGIGTSNSDCQFLNEDNGFFSTAFVAIDFLLFAVEALDVFGIINLCFFSVIVNNKVLENLGLKLVLLATIVTSLVNYFILCIPTIDPNVFWLRSFIELSFLFSILPTVIAVCLRYTILKAKQKHKNI